MLDFIYSVIIGAIVSISGVLCIYWDKLTHGAKFLKPYNKFMFDAYTVHDTIEKGFYKDRKKAIRTYFGIAFVILGIIILAYAEIHYH